MATKKRPARKKAPASRKQTAAQLHELARQQRRAGDPEAARVTLERAHEIERGR